MKQRTRHSIMESRVKTLKTYIRNDIVRELNNNTLSEEKMKQILLSNISGLGNWELTEDIKNWKQLNVTEPTYTKDYYRYYLLMPFSKSLIYRYWDGTEKNIFGVNIFNCLLGSYLNCHSSGTPYPFIDYLNYRYEGTDGKNFYCILKICDLPRVDGKDNPFFNMSPIAVIKKLGKLLDKTYADTFEQLEIDLWTSGLLKMNVFSLNDWSGKMHENPNVFGSETKEWLEYVRKHEHKYSPITSKSKLLKDCFKDVTMDSIDAVMDDFVFVLQKEYFNIEKDITKIAKTITTNITSEDVIEMGLSANELIDENNSSYPIKFGVNYTTDYTEGNHKISKCLAIDISDKTISEYIYDLKLSSEEIIETKLIPKLQTNDNRFEPLIVALRDCDSHLVSYRL